MTNVAAVRVRTHCETPLAEMLNVAQHLNALRLFLGSAYVVMVKFTRMSCTNWYKGVKDADRAGVEAP